MTTTTNSLILNPMFLDMVDELRALNLGKIQIIKTVRKASVAFGGPDGYLSLKACKDAVDAAFTLLDLDPAVRACVFSNLEVLTRLPGMVTERTMHDVVYDMTAAMTTTSIGSSIVIDIVNALWLMRPDTPVQPQTEDEVEG